jgi:hypothetical protein
LPVNAPETTVPLATEVRMPPAEVTVKVALMVLL